MNISKKSFSSNIQHVLEWGFKLIPMCDTVVLLQLYRGRFYMFTKDRRDRESSELSDTRSTEHVTFSHSDVTCVTSINDDLYFYCCVTWRSILVTYIQIHSTCYFFYIPRCIKPHQTQDNTLIQTQRQPCTYKLTYKVMSGGWCSPLRLLITLSLLLRNVSLLTDTSPHICCTVWHLNINVAYTEGA